MYTKLVRANKEQKQKIKEHKSCKSYLLVSRQGKGVPPIAEKWDQLYHQVIKLAIRCSHHVVYLYWDPLYRVCTRSPFLPWSCYQDHDAFHQKPISCRILLLPCPAVHLQRALKGWMTQMCALALPPWLFTYNFFLCTALGSCSCVQDLKSRRWGVKPSSASSNK